MCDQLKAEEETKSASDTTKLQLSSLTSSNILNEPVISHEYYQLKHRKSIHDTGGGNPELNNQHSKLTSSSGEDLACKLSPNEKTMTVATVSEAFRKSNKFTQDTMIRVNPQLSILRSATQTACTADSSH